MPEKIVTFRSKSDRDKDVDLLAKYREIGIAAIAAANQAFRGKPEKETASRRAAIVGYAD